MSRATRVRTAIAAAGIAAVAIAGALVIGLWLAGRAEHDDPAPRTATVVEQTDGRVSSFTLYETTDTVPGATRASVARWIGLVALFVIPAAGAAGWFGAERLLRSEQRVAADTIAARDTEERRRVQEVVHELRTPLAVTVTNLDLVADATNGESHRYLGAARRAVDRMTQTVDGLDTYGGLAFEPPRLRVDLSIEVRNLAIEHGGLAETRGVRIAVRAPAPVDVNADQQAIHTCVTNLLSNALRHAPRNSTVTMETGTVEDWAFVAVHDDGPGIDPDEHPLVFRRNWRGRYESERDGTRGLGCTIARQVAESQRGRITLESAVGIGSTFVLWLPQSPDAEPAAVVADDGIHHHPAFTRPNA